MMEELKTIRIKDLLFYLCLSWRAILICLLACSLLAFSYTKMKPYTPPAPKEITEDDFNKKRQEYTTKDATGKSLQTTFNELNKKFSELDHRLKNDYYLQIDPENRINKSFEIVISFPQTSSLTPEEQQDIRRSLNFRYMQKMAAPAFYQKLAEGPLFMEPRYMADLFFSEITPSNTVRVQVTGPDKTMRDQLLQNVKSYILTAAHEELYLYQPHFVAFDNESAVRVKDDTISRIRESLVSELIESENGMNRLNAQINNAVNEQLQAGQPSPNAVIRKPYRRNLFLGAFGGLLLGGLTAFFRHRKNLSGRDIRDLSHRLKLLYLGDVQIQGADGTTGKLPGKCLDRFICRLFGMDFRPPVSADRIRFAAEVLGGIAGREEPRSGSAELVVPGAAGQASRMAVLNALQEQLAHQDIPVHLKPTGDLAADPEAVRALGVASGVLFLWSFPDPDEKITREFQLGQSLSKGLWGVLELSEKY